MYVYMSLIVTITSILSVTLRSHAYGYLAVTRLSNHSTQPSVDHRPDAPRKGASDLEPWPIDGGHCSSRTTARILSRISYSPRSTLNSCARPSPSYRMVTEPLTDRLSVT